MELYSTLGTKQNILEGSKASRTSTEMEIKLTNTARASLEELLDDYHDFLRARKFALWEKDSREAQFVRRLGANPDVTYAQYQEFCETRPPFARSANPTPGTRLPER